MSSSSNKIYEVPGFYKGNGIWAVRFTPDSIGIWEYITSFKEGYRISINNNSGTPGYANNIKGSFEVFPYEKPEVEVEVPRYELLKKISYTVKESINESFFTKGRLVNDNIYTNVGGLITSNTFWGRDNSPFIVNSTVVVKNCVLLINGGAIIMLKPGTSLKTEGTGVIKATGPCKIISYNPDLLGSRCYYLKTLGDGKRWIKGGTDSPEDFLAHTFISSHGDVFGALDYLASKGVNSFFALLMNVGGDGDNVYPWLSKYDITHYDVNKLEHWNDIFYHANEIGIHCQLTFNEGELYNKALLGYNNLSDERKLYYREMIARFGYLNAITWNLCEEYNHQQAPIDPNIIKLWATYIKSVDSFDHPITVHNWDDNGWVPFYGDNRFGSIAYQYRPTLINGGFNNAYGNKVVELRNANNILKIPINIDETHFFTSSENNICTETSISWAANCGYTAARREIIYPVYFSGGNLECLLESALLTEDFSEYDKLWDYLYYARKVLETLKFWDMGSNNNLINGVSGNELCFTNGHDYAIYLPYGGNSILDLETPTEFYKWWYNPRTGVYSNSVLVQGSNDTLVLDKPPYDINLDWVVILREK